MSRPHIGEHLNRIRQELTVIDTTLSSLPEDKQDGLLAENLLQRIEVLQIELCDLYRAHNPKRYRAWSVKSLAARSAVGVQLD